MTKPVTIPNTFATATTAIPLSQLDSDFSTVATALNDANTYSNYAADTGVANAYVVTLTGVSTTYSAGLRIQFKAGNANTGASTLNVNGGGTKNITFQDASALSSGTIAANAIVDVMYDGTQFLLMNDPAGTVGTGDVVGPASATANAIVRFDSTTGKLVKNSVVTIADSTGDMSGVGAFTATGNVSFDGGTFVFNESGADKDFRIEGDTEPNLFFTDASTDRVGIGTSSPGQKLEVVGAITSSSSLTAHQTSKAVMAFNTGNAEWRSYGASGVVGGHIFYISAAGGAGLSAAATIDSSGNLGLGVTPSAWNTSWKAIQVGANSALASQGSVTDLQYNAYRNTSNSDTYISSDFATRYRQISGTHTWSTAAAGTANTAVVAASTSYTVVALGTTTLAQWQASFSGLSAIPTLGQVLTSLASPVSPIPNGGLVSQNITFTQAMTLDASGRWMLGTTSPFNAVGASIQSQSGTWAAGIHLRGPSVSNGCYFAASTSSTTTDFEIWNEQNGYLRFATNNVERARITSGGDLLVGSTTAISNIRLRVSGGGINVAQSTSIATGSNTISDSGSSPNTIRFYNATDSNNTTDRFVICDAGASVLRAEIRSNGGLANYSANNVNLSDRREKTNFAPAKSYLETICAIPVQTFNYIDQNMDEDGGLTLGVVAQDVQAVAPELVMESNWGSKEDPKMRLSIYQTDLQYALMKCIQEQQALIASLTARVAALEGTQP